VHCVVGSGSKADAGDSKIRPRDVLKADLKPSHRRREACRARWPAPKSNRETKFPRCPDVGASKFSRLNDWAVETSS